MNLLHPYLLALPLGLLLLTIIAVDLTVCAPPSSPSIVNTVLPPSKLLRPNNNNVNNNNNQIPVPTRLPPPNNNNNNNQIVQTTSPKPVIYNWNKEEYPNPQQSPKFCQRSHPSLVCDPDSILTKEQAEKLDQLTAQTSNNLTKCYCQVCPEGEGGVVVGVALAKNIFRAYNSPKAPDSDEFADFVRRRWQYGTCDNTVLILLVADQTEITISMGVIAAKHLSEEFLQQLVMSHKTEFEQHKLYEGLVNIVGGMRTLIHSNKAPTTPLDGGAGGGVKAVGDGSEPPSSTSTAVAVIGIIAGFMLLIFVLTGTILLAKKRYERVETSTDPSQNPKDGLFITEGGGSGSVKGKREGTEGEEEEEEAEEGDDDDDGGYDEGDGPVPPPLPNTPPPSTPSTRRLSTPTGGTGDYVRVSIDDPDRQQQQYHNNHQNQRQASAVSLNPDGDHNTTDHQGVGHLHGQEEVLDSSSHITTPDLNNSRL